MLAGIPLFPEQASTMAGAVDSLYWVLVALSVFFSVFDRGSADVSGDALSAQAC